MACCGLRPQSTICVIVCKFVCTCTSAPGVPPTAQSSSPLKAIQVFKVCIVFLPGTRTFGFFGSKLKPVMRLLSRTPVPGTTTPLP